MTVVLRAFYSIISRIKIFTNITACALKTKGVLALLRAVSSRKLIAYVANNLRLSLSWKMFHFSLLLRNYGAIIPPQSGVQAGKPGDLYDCISNHRRDDAK